MYKNHSDTLAAARRMYRKHAHTVRWRYSTLKKSAKRKNITLTITFEQYATVVQSGKCYYCGDPLPIVGYGLDRRNHLNGYHITNVAACCAECNRLKGRVEASKVSLEALNRIAAVVFGARA